MSAINWATASRTATALSNVGGGSPLSASEAFLAVGVKSRVPLNSLLTGKNTGCFHVRRVSIVSGNADEFEASIF